MSEMHEVDAAMLTVEQLLEQARARLEAWQNPKPSQASRLFHAMMQGVHGGFLVHGSQRDNPYSAGSLWRYEWSQGFVTGKHYREYEARIDELETELATLKAPQ